MIYKTLVFAPLIGAIIAGFFGRRTGDRAAMAVSTGLLFLSALLSWKVMFDIGFGHSSDHVTLLRWMDVGDFQAN